MWIKMRNITENVNVIGHGLFMIIWNIIISAYRYNKTIFIITGDYIGWRDNHTEEYSFFYYYIDRICGSGPYIIDFDDIRGLSVDEDGSFIQPFHDNPNILG